MHFLNFLLKNYFWPKIIFLLLRKIWLPRVHCIFVLFLLWSHGLLESICLTQIVRQLMHKKAWFVHLYRAFLVSFSESCILKKPFSRRSSKIQCREHPKPDTSKADISVKVSKKWVSEYGRLIYQHKGHCILTKSYNSK